MSLPILLRHEAELDLADAAIFYEQRQSGLGLRFASALQRTLERIARYPTAYAILDFDIRRAPVRSFPFGVYYRIEAKRMVVIAVFHARRDPIAWERRVT